VVELSSRCNHVFETPRDKFVWTSAIRFTFTKLLTGRANRSPRSAPRGLNGFALRRKVRTIVTGGSCRHRALAPLGMAAARDKLGSNENVLCIFGDAALTNGISFEALQ